MAGEGGGWRETELCDLSHSSSFHEKLFSRKFVFKKHYLIYHMFVIYHIFVIYHMFRVFKSNYFYVLTWLCVFMCLCCCFVCVSRSLAGNRGNWHPRWDGGGGGKRARERMWGGEGERGCPLVKGGGGGRDLHVSILT